MNKTSVYILIVMFFTSLTPHYIHPAKNTSSITLTLKRNKVLTIGSCLLGIGILITLQKLLATRIIEDVSIEDLKKMFEKFSTIGIELDNIQIQVTEEGKRQSQLMKEMLLIESDRKETEEGISRIETLIKEMKEAIYTTNK